MAPQASSLPPREKVARSWVLLARCPLRCIHAPHQTADPPGVALQQALPRAPPPSSEQDPLSRKADDRRGTGRLRRCGCGGDGVGLLRGEPDIHHVGAVRRELLPQRRHPIERPEFFGAQPRKGNSHPPYNKVSAKTKAGGESLAYELWGILSIYLYILLAGGNHRTAPDLNSQRPFYSVEKRAFGRTIVLHSSLPQEAAPQ